MAKKANLIIGKVREYLKILQKNDYRIKKAYLYGSYATANYHKDSDIDVLIISDDFTGDRFEDSLKILKFARNIDLRIEPMPYRSRDFKDSDPLVIEVKKRGKEIKV
ncbi:MAG TPA: nucleotidyltransferase domain-containing protein [bacterium (Candidatus Stahlbacteria)]|nr:nucleotidyltransferase domain-containing protein [Candidatus Stahlbacteria bacterium]